MSGESYNSSFEASSPDHLRASDSSYRAATRSSTYGGVLLHLGVERWGVAEVEKWLVSRQLSKFVDIFKSHDVTGKVLLRLTIESLRNELNVPEPYDRLIMNEITTLESKSMDVQTWSEGDVCSWVASIGLQEYLDTFQFHNITGELLLHLTKNDIEEDLEIKKVGHRELLLDEIAKLRYMCARRGVRGLTHGYGRAPAAAHTTPDDIARLEIQRQQRLRKELEDLKRKVVQMRDAESRAKVRAMQVESEASKLERQLVELREKTQQRAAAVPSQRLAMARVGTKRVTVDHCTFKPQLNPNSMKMAETRYGDGQDFTTRMSNEIAIREGKLKELIKKQEAGGENLQEKQQKRLALCYKFFRTQVKWNKNTEDIQTFINKVLDTPEAYRLDKFLDEKQIRHIRKLRGHEQTLCMYDQFCVREFVERQQEVIERKHSKGSSTHKQDKNKEALTKAEEYFKDRFKWSSVDSAKLNDLLDSAHVLELELNEASLRHLRGLKYEVQVTGLYKALQTMSFLQRNDQDIRKRESNLQQMWKHHTQSIKSLGGLRDNGEVRSPMEAVHSFLNRVEEDLRSRGERFEKLVDKVKTQDPNFRECTFTPEIYHAKRSRPQSAPAKAR